MDDPREVYAASRRLAAETGGHYLDQFTYAERATDWRGNNNIAEVDLRPDAARARIRCRAWVVCGAGTGGTSATIGRYIRYRRLATRLCVVDPERSVFHRHWADRERDHGRGAVLLHRGHRPAAGRALVRAASWSTG